MVNLQLDGRSIPNSCMEFNKENNTKCLAETEVIKFSVKTWLKHFQRLHHGIDVYSTGEMA